MARESRKTLAELVQNLAPALARVSDLSETLMKELDATHTRAQPRGEKGETAVAHLLARRAPLYSSGMDSRGPCGRAWQAGEPEWPSTQILSPSGWMLPGGACCMGDVARVFREPVGRQAYEFEHSRRTTPSTAAGASQAADDPRTRTRHRMHPSLTARIHVPAVTPRHLSLSRPR